MKKLFLFFLFLNFSRPKLKTKKFKNSKIFTFFQSRKKIFKEKKNFHFFKIKILKFFEAKIWKKSKKFNFFTQKIKKNQKFCIGFEKFHRIFFIGEKLNKKIFGYKKKTETNFWGHLKSKFWPENFFWSLFKSKRQQKNEKKKLLNSWNFYRFFMKIIIA